MASLQGNALSIDDVLSRPDIWRGDQLASSVRPAVASGHHILDEQLPGGGWPRGSVSEILGDQSGIGECTLVLPALRQIQREGRSALLVAPPHALNAPAWQAAGCDLERLVVVATQNVRDTLWAAEQALASGALGAVLCWARAINAAQVRRLELAVSGSDALAFLFRPADARHAASPCALRLLLSSTARAALAVELLKRRGPPCPRTLHLDLARPLPWRVSNEPALARRPSAAAGARIATGAVAA